MGRHFQALQIDISTRGAASHTHHFESVVCREKFQAFALIRARSGSPRKTSDIQRRRSELMLCGRARDIAQIHRRG